MIYVVHQPEGGQATAWFAFNADDLLRKVAAGDTLPAHAIWDCATARELLALLDATPAAPGAQARFPGLFALGQADGWDTPLYRADHLQEAGFYSPAAVRCEDACFAALRARGGTWKFYENEPHALAAVDLPDPLYDAPGGWRARHALRQQLIAVEALADDL